MSAPVSYCERCAQPLYSGEAFAETSCHDDASHKYLNKKLPAREQLGRLVRATWVSWAREQCDPKPHWLASWDALPEPMREVDRRIGETILEYIRAELIVPTPNYEHPCDLPGCDGYCDHP